MSYRFPDSLQAGSWSCSQAVSKPAWHIRAIAVCTVKNSWWWTAELSETCRVLFQKYIWEISASSWFYYKNLSRCTVTWTSNWFPNCVQREFKSFSFRYCCMAGRSTNFVTGGTGDTQTATTYTSDCWQSQSTDITTTEKFHKMCNTATTEWTESCGGISMLHNALTAAH